MSAKYRYKVLKATDIFRLLEVDRGQPDEDLVCSLIHIDSNNIPSYEALSYTWGSDGPLKSIKIHGTPTSFGIDGTSDRSDTYLSITSNLHSALRRFRLLDRSRLIWADAICINQNDDIERGQQVGIMKDIYSKATQVLIWLGEGFEGDRMVFDLIERFTTDFNTDAAADGFTLAEPLRIPDDYDYDKKATALAISLSNMDDQNNLARWNALRLFLDKPWFTRVWIVQEAVLATQAQVFCGDFQLCSFDVLCQMVIWLCQRGLGGWLRGVANSVLAMISILRTDQELGFEPAPLISTLNLFRRSRSTDHRDRIFALLGVTSKRLGITPDYTLSWQQVYIHFAARAAADETCFFMLSSAGCPAEDDSSVLPSWVPDWSSNRRYPLLLHYSPWLCFKAAMNTTVQISYSSDTHTIHVDGFGFDNIRVVSQVGLDQAVTSDVPSTNFDKSFMISQHQKIREIFREWDTITNASNNIHHYPDYEDICARLHLCGRTVSDVEHLFPPDQLLKEVLRELRRRLDHIEHFETYVNDYPGHDKYNSLVDTYMNTMAAVLPWRRLCMTERGYLALVPETGRVGDIVCILSGAEIPYVLRLCDDGKYLLVGECYVEGIMFGEALSKDDLIEQTFTIK